MPSDRVFPAGGQEFERSPEDYGPKQELYGLFRGIVEDTNDPEYRCRVKVRIDGLHSNDVARVPTLSLMWCELLPQDGGGRNHGDHSVPYAYGDAVGVALLRGRCAPFPQAFIIGAWSGMLENKDDHGETATEHYGSGATETVAVGAEGVPPVNNDAFRYPEVPREVWQYFDRYDQPKEESGEPKVKPYEIYPRRRVIKSRHGHVIEISDEPADYEVIIRTPIGQRIWLRESCRNASEERPVWVDGLDTGEKVCRKTSKMFPRSIEIRDSKNNYIHMNTEDGLLDIFFDGDKREHITGNFHQTIDGAVVRKVGHFTQEEYGFNPAPLTKTAPHPLWMMENGTPSPNCPNDSRNTPPAHWVKRLYHNYVEETVMSDFFRWVQGHVTTVVAVGNYLLDLLGVQADPSVPRMQTIIRAGSQYTGIADGDRTISVLAGAITETAGMEILQSAGGVHISWGSIVDHNPGGAPEPVPPPGPPGPAALVAPSSYTEPTAAEYPYPYCDQGNSGTPGNCLHSEDCNCDCGEGGGTSGSRGGVSVGGGDTGPANGIPPG